jgi:hypothetical protein
VAGPVRGVQRRSGDRIPRDRDATVQGRRLPPAVTSGSDRPASAWTCEPSTGSRFVSKRSTSPSTTWRSSFKNATARCSAWRNLRATSASMVAWVCSAKPAREPSASIPKRRRQLLQRKFAAITAGPGPALGWCWVIEWTSADQAVPVAGHLRARGPAVHGCTCRPRLRTRQLSTPVPSAVTLGEH